MKRLLIALLCLAGPLHAKDPSPAHNDLRTFIELAKTCKASAENSTDAEAIKTYSAVSKIARNGGKRLQLCHLLDDAEAAQLCTEIATGMEKLSPPKRQVAVAPHTTRQAPSLRATVSTFKKEHEDTLLKPTTTRRLVERIALKTAIELAYKHYKKKQGYSGNEKADIPTISQRLNSFRTLDHGGLALRNALEYAAIKVFAQALTDELLPTGVSSQKQRLLELAAPSLLAELLHKRQKTTALGLIMSVLPKMLLTRFYMDRNNKYYKYVDTAARLLPFLLGPTLFPYLKGSRSRAQVTSSWQNTGANALVDGFVSMAVFDGIPALIERALPNARKNPSRAALAMNKKSRRKWTKNLVRDMVRQWVDGLSGSSFK